jgi:hypothetical protein
MMKRSVAFESWSHMLTQTSVASRFLPGLILWGVDEGFTDSNFYFIFVFNL